MIVTFKHYQLYMGTQHWVAAFRQLRVNWTLSLGKVSKLRAPPNIAAPGTPNFRDPGRVPSF